jgi:Bifunctional DNA primase/polymerase, N-terminal
MANKIPTERAQGEFLIASGARDVSLVLAPDHLAEALVWVEHFAPNRVGPHFRDDRQAWRDADGGIVKMEAVARAALIEAPHLFGSRFAEPATNAVTTDQPTKPSRRAVNLIFAEHAPRLWDGGLSPVPLRAGSKRPGPRKWQIKFCDTRPPRDQIEGEYSAAYRGHHMDGIGIATHNGLLIIDPEYAEELAEVYRIVANARRAPLAISTKPNGGGKLFMRLPKGVDPCDWNIPAALTGGRFELLAWRRQGAIPPTKYGDNGDAYRWADPTNTLECLDDATDITLAELIALRDRFVISKASKPEARTKVKAEARAVRLDRRIAETIRWNGCPQDFARDMAAIRALDFRVENYWRSSANAIAAKYGDYAPAWTVWEAWAGQWVPTKRIEKTNAQMTAEAMRNAATGFGSRMGYIIDQAKINNFDASLARWPGIKESRGEVKAMKAEVPTDAVSFVGRESHMYAILTDEDLQPIHLKIAMALHLFWSNGDAWPSPERLAIIVRATRDKVVRGLSLLQAKGYLDMIGYGIGHAYRRGGKRNITLTTPAGRTWGDLIADRDYGRGCDLKELHGARCPDDATRNAWIARRRGVDGQRYGGDVSNGTATTDVVMVVQTFVAAARSEARQPITAVNATSIPPSPVRSTSYDMPDMTHDSWQSLMSSMDSSDTINISDSIEDNREAVASEDNEELKIARHAADNIDPEHRTVAQWLASSWLPMSVTSLVRSSTAEKPMGLMAADLMLARENGWNARDTEDAMQAAVRYVTFAGKGNPRHALASIPQRSDPSKTIPPGEVLNRLRERFVIELHERGLEHPEHDRITQEIAYRKEKFASKHGRA